MVLKSVETGDETVMRAHIAQDMIQHNVTIRSGREGMLDVVRATRRQPLKIDVMRVIEDAEHVVVHSVISFDHQKLALMNVFRFEGDQIVEHWDNTQPLEEGTVGHPSMIDGPTEVDDLEMTAEHQMQTAQAVVEIFEQNSLDAMRFYFAEDVIEHAPHIDDGLDARIEHRKSMLENVDWDGTGKCYMIVCEGNFVFLMSSFSTTEQLYASFELFRIENEKVAEHWSVVSRVPDKSKWANEDGKF